MKSEKTPLIGMKIADMSMVSDRESVSITPEEYVAGSQECIPCREIKVVNDGSVSQLVKVNVPRRQRGEPGPKGPGPSPGPRPGPFRPSFPRDPFFVGRLLNKPGWLELNPRNRKIAKYYVAGTRGKSLDHLRMWYDHMDVLAKAARDCLEAGHFEMRQLPETPLGCEESYYDDGGLDYLLNMILRRELDESPVIREITDRIDRSRGTM